MQHPEPVDVFLTHLPPNLRAKFGRARCRELLADQAEVQRVWQQLTPPQATGIHGNQHQRSQRRQPQRLPPLSQHQAAGQDWYAVLSQQFNSDYSPGVTATKQWLGGHSGDTHNPAAFQRSAEFNTTGAAYKLCRDEFSAYNEIIHVERKFNSQWASRERDSEQPKRPDDASRPQASLTSTTKRTQQQPEPVSILTASTQNVGGRTQTKRVTISEEPVITGGQAKQSLHRANTVQP